MFFWKHFFFTAFGPKLLLSTRVTPWFWSRAATQTLLDQWFWQLWSTEEQNPKVLLSCSRTFGSVLKGSGERIGSSPAICSTMGGDWFCSGFVLVLVLVLALVLVLTGTAGNNDAKKDSS